MLSLVKIYTNTFKGLSKDIWWLALVTLINRAGTMILPFLSKYLKESLAFSFSDVGWIMLFFGLGSMIGSYLGGRLTDKIGYYKVMLYSLLITGFLFIGLQFVRTFWGFCISLLVVMSVADMFRPALFVSLKAYSKPENQTRSLTLIRLAINLGFALGPTLAGLIIIIQGYQLLFWIDGITCITAILLFFLVLKEKPLPKLTHTSHELFKKTNVYNDTTYWLFLSGSLLTGIVFFQFFTTLPLYHTDQFNLTEFHTGLLFFLNGFLIVTIEMPLIYWFEKRKFKHTKLIYISTLFITASFVVLFINAWVGSLILSMILLTFGEMINFPYSNAFALSRAKSGNEGRYMAFYTMSFSLAHVISPKLGLDLIANYGYTVNWIVFSLLSLTSILIAIWLVKRVKNEEFFNSRLQP